jgi:hypothetical protein
MTTKQYSVVNEAFWVRVIFMLITACVVYISVCLTWLLVLVQLLIAAVSGQANDNLKSIGGSLGQVIGDGFKFLCFQSEAKPFPFSDWPKVEELQDDRQEHSLD